LLNLARLYPALQFPEFSRALAQGIFMTNRKTLTDRGVAALRPMAGRYALPDPELRGHYVRVMPSGAKSFVAVTTNPNRKQVWTTIGPADAMSIAQARARARDVLNRVRAGLPALEAKAETFADVAANWIRRHVEPKGLRSAPEIRRLLDRHILPEWREREFIAIRRSDVAALLDRVEDDHGARQADYVLNVARSIMNWYAARHDDYTPPIVRGMRRQNPHAQARARILDDGELRAIWKAAEAAGTFGAILRLCLLTAQRSRKVASMRWADVSLDGEWRIPAAAREKGTAGALVLQEAALAIVGKQPRLGSNPHVFAGRGSGPFRGFSATKATFDAKLPPGMPSWVVHDLRRTARSLMARAGVRPDIAERVMGHAIPGIEGVYDRHSYRDEKADALRRLAALIDGIVNPRDKVVPMAKRNRQ
jgi:integrase